MSKIKVNTFYERFGKLTAISTFSIATIICLSFIYKGDLTFGFYGFMFLLIAFLINILILVSLLIIASNAENSKQIYWSVKLMLANIPIAILYFGIGFYFVGIVRIKIENNTGSDISNISISGCEQKFFKLLENGDSEITWINIPNDCSIHLSYTNAYGELVNETIMGYVSSGMGQKFTYRIGEGEKTR
ncbi:hypothetical protein [Brumimicrobium mesophilum]|uniref:hypothetical protein n=1 Tax=Brumimicrobium mesophilum TaxID=392717 RepID=UPI000D13FCF5|nr:hypothetical protein [Brumimicrobium mesophilum]